MAERRDMHHRQSIRIVATLCWACRIGSYFCEMARRWECLRIDIPDSLDITLVNVGRPVVGVETAECGHLTEPLPHVLTSMMAAGLTTAYRDLMERISTRRASPSACRLSADARSGADRHTKCRIELTLSRGQNRSRPRLVRALRLQAPPHGRFGRDRCPVG